MDSQPEWISEFTERVCTSIRLFDEGAPIGCHYYCGETSHEISVFVSATEIVGGPNDGQRIVARYVVDLIELMQVFDLLDNYSWQPQVIDASDEVGPHVAISGEYQGEQIWLRILAQTPEQFLPGRIAKFTDRKFIDLWESAD